MGGTEKASHSVIDKFGGQENAGGQGPSAGLTREPWIDYVWAMGVVRGS